MESGGSAQVGLMLMAIETVRGMLSQGDEVQNKTYSAWGVGGTPSVVVEGVRLSDELRQLEPELELVRTFKATSWEDAMRQYSEWLWNEPYTPMAEDER